MSESGDRGFRNCNPGNIRKGLPWVGLSPVQSDPDFCQFVAPQWGIRAIAKILLHYEGEGVRTVRKAINTWAPPTENDTDAYVADVSRSCGVDPDADIDLRAYLDKLVPAIIVHENGSNPYSADVIALGISLAEGT